MYRGTTPTHVFKTKLDLSIASELYVTYVQDKETKAEKTLKDVTFAEGQFSVELTQEETLSFSTIGTVEIQIRVKFPDGKALASNIIKRSAGAILKEGVI